jgi:cytochrome P450
VVLAPASPRRFRFSPRKFVATFDRTRSADLWDQLGEFSGDSGLAWFRFTGVNNWVVTRPEWVRQVLTAPPEVIVRSGTFRRLGSLIGDSLLTTDGPAHRLRRRQMQPAFHRQRLTAYADSMVAAATATAELWRDGQRVAMEQEMAALTMDAIGRSVLGIDGREVAPRVAQALDRLLRALPLLFVPRFELLADHAVPGLGWLRRALEVLHGVARDAARDSETELVAALREVTADVPELSREQVSDELLTLLLAGHETTAVALTWAWWFLDAHPDVADRIRAEVGEVVGDRAPTYDDVARLQFTQAVVAETLRLRPPAWILERQVAGDIEFGGHCPQPGTVLFLPIWVMHHDPKWWQDPLVFDPSRWLTVDGRYDENAPGQPRGAYLPFGAGAHVCIGASFAWTEVVLALTVLVPRWRAALASDAKVGIRATITLRPANGMAMALHARA